MNKKIRNAGIVLNGFVHDFATGYWLSGMIAIYFLHQFQGKYIQVHNVLGIIERFFFWNTITAVVVIFATGGVRTFTYVDNFFGQEAEKIRRKMLVAKHVALILIFTAGGYWAFKMAFH
ncbi:MAG: hypothetical protein PHY09_17340 [Desulfuromonadaceae bacterium]|nr:hypothetical protein [Desulfuromonadaceae bacterium]MDD5107295.1 hypothetical protein [Desulfuromonadaceae bacterium]